MAADDFEDVEEATGGTSDDDMCDISGTVLMAKRDEDDTVPTDVGVVKEEVVGNGRTGALGMGPTRLACQRSHASWYCRRASWQASSRVRSALVFQTMCWLVPDLSMRWPAKKLPRERASEPTFWRALQMLAATTVTVELHNHLGLRDSPETRGAPNGVSAAMSVSGSKSSFPSQRCNIHFKSITPRNGAQDGREADGFLGPPGSRYLDSGRRLQVNHHLQVCHRVSMRALLLGALTPMRRPVKTSKPPPNSFY